jgi:hypothetical protein
LSGQSAADIAAHVVVYPVSVWFGMLPFSALLPLLVAPGVRRQVRERFGDLFVFCSLAVLVNFPVYWFRGDVAVRYFLPMFPFVLLVAAMVFDVLENGMPGPTRRVGRYLAFVRWSVVAIAAACAVLLLASIGLPRFIEDHEALLPGAVAAGLALAGCAALWRLVRRARAAPMPALLLLFCTMLVLGRGMYYNIVLADRVVRYAEDRNAPRIAAELQQHIVPDETLYVHGVPWSVWYYGDELGLEPLSADAPPAPGSWILILEGLRGEAEPLGFPSEAAASFSYKGDVLLLGRVPEDRPDVR